MPDKTKEMVKVTKDVEITEEDEKKRLEDLKTASGNLAEKLIKEMKTRDEAMEEILRDDLGKTVDSMTDSLDNAIETVGGLEADFHRMVKGIIGEEEEKAEGESKSEIAEKLDDFVKKIQGHAASIASLGRANKDVEASVQKLQEFQTSQEGINETLNYINNKITMIEQIIFGGGTFQLKHIPAEEGEEKKEG